MPELQCLKQQRKKNDVDDLDGNHNFDELVGIFKKFKQVTLQITCEYISRDGNSNACLSDEMIDYDINRQPLTPLSKCRCL